ncbi:MAG: pyridoxal-dependent decarboxylase [Rhizomicrobium sp.]
MSDSETALFPSWPDREKWEDWLTRAIAGARARISAGPVTPSFDIEVFRDELSAYDFAVARPMEQLLSWTIAQMEHGIVHLTHPRYFGLFNPLPTFPAECADRIAAAFNPQLATWTTSPAAVEIEAHVIGAVGRRAGFEMHTSGCFTTGGAEANFTALLCALTRICPNYSMTGARAFSGRPVVYVSRECHLAWLKIAHQAGIGRSAVSFIRTDGAGRLDPAALEDAIAADRARGCVPIMVVATAGTTNAGMIDPLHACARIAEKEKLWFHVDAAWGGALMASDKGRAHLAGMELADSITIDAHKWFATTMGCGMFITPRASVLSSTFHVSAEFMPSNLEGIDPYTASIQWSRRFVGLRLFLSLAAAGWIGFGSHIEHATDLANSLKMRLSAIGWSVANNSDLAVVCAEPPAGSPSPRAIVEKLLEGGRAWVSTTKFEGRDVIRACITHGTTSLEDVEELTSILQQASTI